MNTKKEEKAEYDRLRLKRIKNDPIISEKHRMRKAEYYQLRRKNDPSFLEKRRVNRKNWYENNKERAGKVGWQWYNSHKSVVKEKNRRWRKNNVAKMRALKLAWMNKTYHNPVYKLIRTQRSRIHYAFKQRGAKKNERTITLLGCTTSFLKEYLTSKLCPGMTWDNHGLFGWHVDHIKPISSFDFTDPKQIEAAFHYKNLQPLWWFDNLKKGNKVA